MERKTVTSTGTSLVVPLTKKLRKKGFEKGDKVHLKEVGGDDETLILALSKGDEITNDKFIRIDRWLWNQFYDIVKKHYDGTHEAALEEAFKDFINQYGKWQNRPLFKIG